LPAFDWFVVTTVIKSSIFTPVFLNLIDIAGFPYCVFGYFWGDVVSDALPF
jgi:hypothetical protein